MLKQNHPDSTKWNMLRLSGGELVTTNSRSVFDYMEDVVYIINKQYEIEFMNPTLLLGLGPVNGRKCFQYLHNVEEPCPDCPNNIIFAGRTIREEWHETLNDKTYDLVATPLRRADSSIAKLTILRDITEQKKAEEELGIYRNNLEELVENRTAQLTTINKNRIVA